MKKGIVLLSFLILVGCGEKVEPVKETVDTIQNSKKSVVTLQVNNLLKEAEIKLLYGSTSNCILAKDLSGNATSGSICYDNSGTIYAKDIKIDGFVCNGNKTNLSCVGDSSDK